MSRAKLMKDLQRTDLKRDELRSTLLKIDAALRNDGGVAAAQSVAADADAKLAALEQELRRLSLERDAAKDHVAREEKQLYGGKVRVAKELQNLEMEVESLRRQLKTLDDRALDLMLERDEAADHATQAHETLSQTQSKSASQRKRLTERQVSMADELGRLDEQREKVAQQVAAGDMQSYERLRKAKGGRAVSELRDGSCMACGMLLPQSAAARAIAGDRVTCDGCGRIVLG